MCQAASSRTSAGQKLLTVSHLLAMIDRKGKGASGAEVSEPQGKEERKMGYRWYLAASVQSSHWSPAGVAVSPQQFLQQSHCM